MDVNKSEGISASCLVRYLQHGGQLHKPYQQDRRWAHEGTIAYTSRQGYYIYNQRI